MPLPTHWAQLLAAQRPTLGAQLNPVPESTHTSQLPVQRVSSTPQEKVTPLPMHLGQFPAQAVTLAAQSNRVADTVVHWEQVPAHELACASQLPDTPQTPQVPSHRLGTIEHVPSVPMASQRWQFPAQVLLQQ